RLARTKAGGNSRTRSRELFHQVNRRVAVDAFSRAPSALGPADRGIPSYRRNSSDMHVLGTSCFRPTLVRYLSLAASLSAPVLGGPSAPAPVDLLDSRKSLAFPLVVQDQADTNKRLRRRFLLTEARSYTP